MMTLFVLISSIINQWKIASLQKKYTRWIVTAQAELQKLIEKIQVAELRRIKLLQETSSREKEINEYLAQIEEITLDLKQEEEKFIVKEKKLIQELHSYEVTVILHLRIILYGSMQGRGYISCSSNQLNVK